MKTNKGFTIIELLVVMVIITILIGILVPSIGAVRRQAKSLSQKSQLRDITIGVEGWRNSHDHDYPDSNPEFATGQGRGGTWGSLKLCEALAGRDLQGYDSKTTWNASRDEADDSIYAQGGAEISYSRDKGEYVNLSRVSAFQPAQIYSADHFLTGSSAVPYSGDRDANGNIFASGKKPCYVFTDVFKRKKITVNGDTAKVGTPILYYKAHSTSVWGVKNRVGNVFEFSDNWGMMSMGKVGEETEEHPMYRDWLDNSYEPRIWFEALTNKERTVPEPYNRSSFVLLSAGADGLFGTKDDVWNISGQR